MGVTLTQSPSTTKATGIYHSLMKVVLKYMPSYGVSILVKTSYSFYAALTLGGGLNLSVPLFPVRFWEKFRP